MNIRNLLSNQLFDMAGQHMADGLLLVVNHDPGTVRATVGEMLMRWSNLEWILADAIEPNEAVAK